MQLDVEAVLSALGNVTELADPVREVIEDVTIPESLRSMFAGTANKLVDFMSR